MCLVQEKSIGLLCKNVNSKTCKDQSMAKQRFHQSWAIYLKSLGVRYCSVWLSADFIWCHEQSQGYNISFREVYYRLACCLPLPSYLIQQQWQLLTAVGGGVVRGFPNTGDPVYICNPPLNGWTGPVWLPENRQNVLSDQNSETLEQCFWELTSTVENNKATIWAERIRNKSKIKLFSLSLALWWILLKA